MYLVIANFIFLCKLYVINIQKKNNNKKQNKKQEKNVISLSLPGQSDVPCFTMVIFHHRWLSLAAKCLKSHQIETKTSNSIQRPFRKS